MPNHNHLFLEYSSTVCWVLCQAKARQFPGFKNFTVQSEEPILNRWLYSRVITMHRITEQLILSAYSMSSAVPNIVYLVMTK